MFILSLKCINKKSEFRNRVSIPLALFLFITLVSRLTAQEKTVQHDFMIEAGITVSGEHALSGKSNRVSPNLFALAYQRTAIKTRQKGFIGNSIQIRSEILSGFYVPVTFAYLFEEVKTYRSWRVYAPGFSVVGEVKYMLKLRNNVDIGVSVGDVSFPHSIIYLGPSKMYAGLCASVPKGALKLPFHSECDLYFTLKRPWSEPTINSSPYNVMGLSYKAILDLSKKGKVRLFTGVRYLKLLPPGSRHVPGGGQAYRLDLGLQFRFSKQKSNFVNNK